MSFQGFLFVVSCIGLKALSVTTWILHTAKIKSITESFWVKRFLRLIHLDRLINYSYSFRKQSAASVFKNKNCCFPDQGNVCHYTTNLLKQNLTYSSIFKAYFMKIFAAAKSSLVFVKNRCRSSRSQMFFKWMLLNFCNIHRKALVLESLFNKAAGLMVFSCEYCEIFKFFSKLM